jgi:anaerobic selenocysteine-containing dehydrogenase
MDFSEQLATDKFKSLLVWNTNPAASAPNQKQLHDALRREYLFTVVIDCFQTDTADYADIVLPAASFLEFDDLTCSYFHLNMGAQVKAIEPLGESLPNQEIFRRMAKAMDYEDAELFESDDQLIQEMLTDMNIDISFEQLKKKGWFSLGEEAMIFYDDLKFATPSGKIEIASDRAVENGLPRLPLPLADEKPDDGKLRLITPASIWRMNDSYSNDPQIIKRSNDASITLHPDDADRLNISDGDQVTLSNEAGKIQLIAKIERLTPSGVALSYKGRWPKLESTACNVNSIHLAKKTDMGESTSVHSTEITVTRF